MKNIIGSYCHITVLHVELCSRVLAAEVQCAQVIRGYGDGRTKSVIGLNLGGGRSVEVGKLNELEVAQLRSRVSILEFLSDSWRRFSAYRT